MSAAAREPATLSPREVVAAERQQRLETGPLQLPCEVVSLRRVGDYYALRFLAPGIPERTRPGQFVALGVGDAESSMLLRRSFSVYRTSTRGPQGGTVDIVFAVHGKGTAWLAERRPHDVVDVVGPLGRAFPVPRDPANAVLVGGGYGSAPLFTLAEQLRRRRCRVDVVLGAATEGRLFGADEARRLASTVTVTTEDGSVGERGMVTDVLGDVMERGGTEVVYACGPMAMLRAVTAMAQEHGAVAQTAVEESMACGVGVCMTCVLPVVGDDGLTRMVRSCTEGPVFRGDRVRWDDIGTIPADMIEPHTTAPATIPPATIPPATIPPATIAAGTVPPDTVQPAAIPPAGRGAPDGRGR